MTRKQMEMVKNLLEDVVDAVELQIPKDVLNKTLVGDNEDIYGDCPICGCLTHDRYCGNCGQKINWEVGTSGERY